MELIFGKPPTYGYGDGYGYGSVRSNKRRRPN